jgi:integrase
MSRRSGQKGHIEPSGKWYVVRWWMDVPGQEKRSLERARICPISGPGSMTKSERQRRASEIIARSGADTEKYFNSVAKPVQSEVTFREQAEIWFSNETTRKRNPVATATKEFWRGCLDNWLIPNLSDLPVSEVNNGAVKRVVPIMMNKLSPKTITSYVGVIKQVVASAVNKDGEELYPRKWNPEFMDLPVVEKSKQNTPAFTSEVMSGLARWKNPTIRMIFILCGAAGLRIGEALGIDISKHISSDFRTVTIEQKARNCKIETRVKTKNSFRKVDLHTRVAVLLKEYVGDRKTGLLFASRNGKPLSQSNILKRHLHPALLLLGYVNSATGTHKAGNHAFRRFRNTYLRNRANCPVGLYQYWLGHAEVSMSALYDKIKEDNPFRLEWAEKCGIGFELLSVVPNVPKTEEINSLLEVA